MRRACRGGLSGVVLVLVLGSSMGGARVLLQDGAQTLGDLSPIVIGAEGGRMPDVSLEEAVQRHVRVFRQAEDALVRVRTLNRIQNLQARFGDRLGLADTTAEALHRAAREDFETLLAEASGDRHAELLYQAARSSDIAGAERRSVDYLERILDAHGESPFAAESAFRVGEYRFREGLYARAADAFRRARERGSEQDFRDDSLYMLGWSRFLNDEAMAAAGLFLNFLDRHHADDAGFAAVSGKDAEQVEDAHRVLSLIATYARGPETLAAIMDNHGERPYVARLYRHLIRFQRARGDHQGSVAAAKAFRDRYPEHEAAPLMLTEAVRSWRLAGKPQRMRDAMARAVSDYAASEVMEGLEPAVQGALLGYLRELGVWHYAQGQRRKGTESRSHYREASRHLRRYADRRDRFPARAASRETGAGYMVLLAGDAALRGGNANGAAQLYERAAYSEAPFPGAGEAAYALVQLRRDQWREKESEENRDRFIADASRYVQAFPRNTGVYGVQQTLANRLYEADRPSEAGAVARALAEADEAPTDRRRAGWIVLGHIRMDASEYADAASAWARVRELTPEDDARLADFRRRHAVALYRAAEALQAADRLEPALSRFADAQAAAPGTEVAASARFDRAGVLLVMDRWDEAVRALEEFRTHYPDHELAQRAAERIVHAHSRAGRPGEAADTMLAATPPDLAGKALWQYRLRAAGYYREAERLGDAVSLYEQYLSEGIDHLGNHGFQQERRHELITMQAELGREDALTRTHAALVEAETDADGTDRSAWLASRSALWLGRRAADQFAGIALGAPLEESLARKRDALDDALSRFRQAEQFGFKETATESTYRMAELYRQLARDVIDSERPEGLTDQQASQYEMLLEEEAYPFEEKAIELHRRNQKRIPEGHWTGWVSRSLERLADLFPARYERDLQWTEARHEASR